MSRDANIGDPATPVGSAAALGQRFRAARLEQGLTQEELADIAGLTRPHLVQIEKGKTTERLEQVFRLAGLLGLELTIRPRGASRGATGTE